MLLYLYIILTCYLPIIEDFIPKTDFGEGIPDLGPVRIGSFLLLLLFIIHSAIKKDVKVINVWIGILVMFYTIEFSSVLWSAYSYNSVTLQLIYNSSFIPFFLAFLAMNLFDNEKNAHAYLKHITISVFIMAIISIVQMILSVMTGLSDFRAAGTFGNPNLLAIILVLAIPCAVYAADNNIVPSWFGKITSITIILGVMCTVSRKGIITMVLCYIIYHFLHRNYRKIVTVFVGFAILAALLSGYTMVTQRFAKEKFIQQWSEKWLMTTTGWEMFKTSPIHGLGYKGYYNYFSVFNPNSHKENYDAHNIYITALANYGLVGFFPFLSIFFYPLIQSWRALPKSYHQVQRTHQADMAIICLSSLVPFMASGWFAGNLFYNPQPMSILYANILLFLALNKKKIAK